MKMQNLLLFFLITSLFIAPVFAEGTTDGTATVEESAVTPGPGGPKTEPIVFDLFVNTPDYIILPFSSSITTTIDVYNRVGRDAEVMFVWSIINDNNLQVKNGSFLHLILGYQQKTLDVEVPAPTDEGDYILQIDVPEIEVTGSSTHPFHVYGIIAWLFGPGWWLLAMIVFVAFVLVCVAVLVKKREDWA